MNPKQQRMLELLDRMIQECEKCELCLNGRAKPSWCDQSYMAIIGEAPGEDEVRENTPFIGRAGDVLWGKMEVAGYKRRDFLIINSVNCRPLEGKKNGKPTAKQMATCRPWLVQYLKVLQPERILLLGAYSLDTILHRTGSMVNQNGLTLFSDEFNAQCTISVHPAYSLYNPSGIKLLEESIINFRPNERRERLEERGWRKI